jgi:hypothetical protein
LSISDVSTPEDSEMSLMRRRSSFVNRIIVYAYVDMDSD